MSTELQANFIKHLLKLETKAIEQQNCKLLTIRNGKLSKIVKINETFEKKTSKFDVELKNAIFFERISINSTTYNTTCNKPVWVSLI